MRLLACATLAFVLSMGSAAAGPEARKLFDQGRKAEQSGDLSRAYLYYSQAVAQDPYNLEYWRRRELVRVPLALGSPSGLPRQDRPAPPPAAAPLPEPLPPPELMAAPLRLDIDWRGDARALFTRLAAAYQLEALFDTDYQPGPAVAFRASQAGYREAFRILESLTNSFVVPVGERTVLVARDTAQKRQELEPVVSVSVPVPTACTAAEAQEVMRAVQQVLALTRISYDAQHAVIVIRDRLSRVRPAQELIARLIEHRRLVAVELEFVELGRTGSLAYGAGLQTFFPLLGFGGAFNSPVTLPSGFTRFLTFGGGASLIGLGVADVQALARESRSEGHSLFRAELRSADGQKATLHVGERYPIVTGRVIYSGFDGESGITPTIQFEDLGLSVEITPRVHDETEVTLELSAEFKALTGQVIDEMPVLANRKLQSSVRLRTGEWGVVAGLMNSSEARTISGLAGFSRVPVIGAAFRNNRRDDTGGDVLLVLKPVVLSLPGRDAAPGAIAVGPELRPRLPL